MRGGSFYRFPFLSIWLAVCCSPKNGSVPRKSSTCSHVSSVAWTASVWARLCVFGQREQLLTWSTFADQTYLSNDSDVLFMVFCWSRCLYLSFTHIICCHFFKDVTARFGVPPLRGFLESLSKSWFGETQRGANFLCSFLREFLRDGNELCVQTGLWWQ